MIAGVIWRQMNLPHDNWREAMAKRLKKKTQKITVEVEASSRARSREKATQDYGKGRCHQKKQDRSNCVD
jgi:uncharacterized protein with PIN domain